jgi:hypothetical protein
MIDYVHNKSKISLRDFRLDNIRSEYTKKILGFIDKYLGIQRDTRMLLRPYDITQPEKTTVPVDDVENLELLISHYAATSQNIVQDQTNVLDTNHSLLATADESGREDNEIHDRQQ